MSTLKELLSGIRVMEDAKEYDSRNLLVMAAVATALAEDIVAGYRIDPSEPDWPVAYIELPTGQVSWHIEQHKKSWDGHDTAEKYRRVAAYLIS